ncbi:hypothetical protein H3H32_16310 [Spirosoma foliorum]|uniref:DNA polymerase beta thumb domain-containing protein n=1 Tax=Spirosoma foliorum TaxID=2710596 RepID=A0A7G5H5E2_9BACT|nr:hypothetical protein H3H32_16310 [Spirosoma foliorum]
MRSNGLSASNAIKTILSRKVVDEPAPEKTKPEPVATAAGATAEAPKMDLSKAQRIAEDLVVLLEDLCDKIHIAGSIRRLKPQVKDIEIVCQPKLFQETDFSLFGGKSQPAQIIPAFRRMVGMLGTPIKGKPDGRHMQIDLPSGIKLDLFMPVGTDYYRQFAIRTGSAEYSAKHIAGSWKKKGWCGTHDGLRLINDCEETKSGWKVVRPNPTLPPAWQSEKEFFDWLGEKWIAPKNRI